MTLELNLEGHREVGHKDRKQCALELGENMESLGDSEWLAWRMGEGSWKKQDYREAGRGGS